MASYSQESTRYCNYSKDKFDNQLTFILPCWFKKYKENNFYSLEDPLFEKPNYLNFEQAWIYGRLQEELEYKNYIAGGWTPEQARSVLPNSLKTEIVMSCNLREWKHIFKLRTSEAAHPQIRELMIPLQENFKKLLPEIFE